MTHLNGFRSGPKSFFDAPAATTSPTYTAADTSPNPVAAAQFTRSLMCHATLAFLHPVTHDTTTHPMSTHSNHTACLLQSMQPRQACTRHIYHGTMHTMHAICRMHTPYEYYVYTTHASRDVVRIKSVARGELPTA